MDSNSIQDQARVAISSVGSASRAALHYALRTPVSRWLSGPPAAHHLLIVPQDLRTADPSFANELNDGYFGLAGAVALTGTESPFSINPPSAAWQRELYAFSWVRNLHAADDEIAQERARALLADWVALGRSAPAIAWDEDVAARRVIALLSHAGFLLDGVDAAFYDSFMRSLTAELHNLTISHGHRSHSIARLRALTALLLSSLCIAEQQAFLNAYLANFQAELERQILPDGGHISRNPGCLIDILLDLLPLKQCFIARKMEPPEFLYAAINRMLPMLRFMRLGTCLTRFNGMGGTPLDFLASVLVYHDEVGKPVNHSIPSGYCRLERGPTAIVADAGGPPPLLSSTRAHAGCLSFEMMSGGEMIVVNCGAPRDAGSDWRVVCRSTAAHSTLTINDASSSRLMKAQAETQGHDTHLLSGPKNVRAEVIEEAGGLLMRAAHDGYRDRFNVSHRRRLKLSADGLTLECVDQLAGPSGKTPFPIPGANFAIRVHLHPGVAAVRTNDPGSVMLALPNDDMWKFTAEGALVDIEESIFLADSIGPRRSLQIVMTGQCASDTHVTWSLAKSARSSKNTVRALVVEPDMDDVEYEEYQ